MRVGNVSNCLYRLISLEVCFWLLIKLIFRSTKIYTSWSSKFSVSDIAVESLSRNLDRSGGRYNIPIKIGLVSGRSMSKKMFSTSLEKLPLKLKLTSLPI